MLQKEINFSKKTWVIISIIVALIITLCVGGYFAYAWWQDQQQQKTEEQASEETKPTDPYGDWLTYTNNKVGYKLRYPKDWTIKETSGTSEITQVPVEYITITSPAQNRLHFGLKKTTDTFYLSDRTGVGAGEDIPLTNKTVLLSAEIIPYKHVWEGKTKEFFYKMGDTGKTKCGCENNIYFSPPKTTSNDTINMSTEEIHTVNVILKSVEWLSGTTESEGENIVKAKEVATKFLDARKTRNITNATPYVTTDFLKNNNQESFAGASSPSFGSYDNLSAIYNTSSGIYEVTATIHWMLQGAESGTSTWTLYVVNQKGKFLVNEMKGSY